ncbi:putative F-box/FBD/LRR-repeat protein At1g78760 [Bidens hawaiensis]|uniref:putative F-box/FBD/LRR-repeat protein At1g78760 n=1 Tax=Bidens hawaiensis TaxID=980011 RepID=UPI00404956C5
MAIKRLPKQQPETQMMKPLKRFRLEDDEEQQPPNAATTMADRLSTLPEDLQLRILSSLDTKHAFQTSLLSKAWSSKWTHLPVLNFDSYSFHKKVGDFDKFVYRALSVPRSAQLVRINFIRRDAVCSAKMLKKVFDYAFKQRVEELDVSIKETRKETGWPMIMSHTSCDSLKSMKLQSYTYIACSYLGPRSGSFKNLASLHLRKAIITDLDPFSGFPALKKLKLVFCQLQTDDNTLNVHAPHLSELTISYYEVYSDHLANLRCNVATLNLKYFEFRGSEFPRFEITRGRPVIDTVIIEYSGYCKIPQHKKLFDDLMIFFNVLRHVKSLTVYSSVVQILSSFPDELANPRLPFRDLKSLKVDLSFFYRQKLFEGNCISLSEALRHVSHVKGYLLQKSPDAKYTMIDPYAPLKARPRCSNSDECTCGMYNTKFKID